MAAFRAAPQDMRAAMLDNLGLARSVSERAAPTVTFNDNSRVGTMVTSTGAINQNNMQINMGERKKKKSYLNCRSDSWSSQKSALSAVVR